MQDSYFTIAGASEGFYKEKGSKFLAFAWPVKSVDEVQSRLTELAKRFHDARHVCYAYRFGAKGEPFRANDDGEPSHSAGDPILNAMRSKEISDAFIGVVRYFGGTKLGVGGLIRAYGTAAMDALEQNKVLEVVLRKRLTIQFAYGFTSEVNRILHQLDIKPDEAIYEADCVQHFDIRESDYEKVMAVFLDLGILRKNKDL